MLLALLPPCVCLQRPCFAICRLGDWPPMVWFSFPPRLEIGARYASVHPRGIHRLDTDHHLTRSANLLARKLSPSRTPSVTSVTVGMGPWSIDTNPGLSARCEKLLLPEFKPHPPPFAIRQRPNGITGPAFFLTSASQDQLLEKGECQAEFFLFLLFVYPASSISR